MGTTIDPGKLLWFYRPDGDVEARSRLDELNAITRQYGRPYTPARPLDEVVKELPAQWYRTWH